jgi:hypothetical protein
VDGCIANWQCDMHPQVGCLMNMQRTVLSLTLRIEVVTCILVCWPCFCAHCVLPLFLL